MRVVREHGADPDDDGVHSGAKMLYVGAGVGRADPLARAVQRGRAPVHSGGELPDHERPGVTRRGPPGRGEPGQVAGLHLRLRAARAPRRPRVSAASSAPPGGDRVRVDDAGHDPDHAGPDQRLRAGTGSADVVARLHRDHRGAAAGPLPRRRERPDLGVRPAGVRVKALTDHLSGGVENDAADDRVRDWWCRDRVRRVRRHASSPRLRSLPFARAARLVALAAAPCVLLAAGMPPTHRAVRRAGEETPMHGNARVTDGGGAGPWRCHSAHVTRIDRALSPIRTVTVGPLRSTLSPPVTGCHRVAGLPGLTIGLRITAGSEFHRVPPARWWV